MTTPLNPYIQYISALTDNGKAPTTISDLVDCLIINQLLSKIQQFPLPKIQHNPNTFAHIFSNLKQTYKHMQLYWNNYLQRPLQCGQLDLVGIAHHGNEEQMQKIIDLFIQSVVQSSSKQYFVGKILQTSPDTQKYFMNIVEQTLQYKTLSPRKQREQRLYDKMMQLDHQNQNLQVVIQQLCNDKLQIQNKYQQLYERIKQKNIQIQRLNDQFFVSFDTPQRRKNNTFDLMQKNSQYIDRLKVKIYQMGKDHQQQIVQYSEQMQILNTKIEKLKDLETKAELYQANIAANNQMLDEFQHITHHCNELKVEIQSKNCLIKNNAEELDNKIATINVMKATILQKDLQLQAINQKNQQLRYILMKYNGDDGSTCLSPMSLRRTLSEHCPDVQNVQIIQQANKKLLQQLQKSSLTIKQLKTALKKLQQQCSRIHKLQSQNNKLLQIISNINQTHKDEKYLLLGALYEIRNRYMKQIQQKSMKKQKQYKQKKKQESAIGLDRSKCIISHQAINLPDMNMSSNIHMSSNRMSARRGLKVMQSRNYEE